MLSTMVIIKLITILLTIIKFIATVLLNNKTYTMAVIDTGVV
jgi:hypothetical protein